jgi:protein-arginine kinase activator protein McsA
MNGMALERREDVRPICPHCQQEIATIAYRELQGTFGRRYVYFCSWCRKVLGVSHRKGFFMG